MRLFPPPRLLAMLAAGLLCAAGSAAAQVAAFAPMPAAAAANPRVASTLAAPADWMVKAGADWMAPLPDASPLGALSIPGTHDSGARFGNYLCQTQTWPIEPMLMAGVRYLDIRNRRSGADFAIHHGPCFQRMNFGDVLDILNRFLAAHPREAVIMRVKEEYKPAKNSLAFRDIWARYAARGGSRLLKATGAIPTLGEARGKVLVLRDAAFDGYGVSFNDEAVKTQDVWQVFDSPNLNPQGADTASVFQKINLIKAHILAAREKGPSGKSLFLNHLSGATGVSPIELARQVNREIFNSIAARERSGPLGVLIMDFPGEALIHQILKANFEPR